MRAANCMQKIVRASRSSGFSSGEGVLEINTLTHRLHNLTFDNTKHEYKQIYQVFDLK